MSSIVFSIAVGFVLQCGVWLLIACAAASLSRLFKRGTNPFPYTKCLIAATLLSVPGAVLDLTRLQTKAQHNTAATEAIYNADGDHMSLADLAAIEQFGSHTRRCNNAVAAMLRDLKDPSLSPEKVPQTLDRHLTELQAACDAMSRSSHSIENAGAANTCRTMASLFTRQKDCWIAIRDAVLAQNPDAEETAYAELARVTEERQVAGREFLDRARKWTPPDLIDQALEAKRRELIEKMKVPE